MNRALTPLAVVAVMLASGALTGCGQDWFGSDPKPEPTPSCATHDVTPPERPPAAPEPGHAIITAELRAVAYPLKADGTWVSADADYEWCIPVLVALRATAVGADGSVVTPQLVTTAGRVVNTPWNGPATTPWRADGDLRWDASQDPPDVTVQLEATYDAQRDWTEGDTPYRGPVALRCAVYVNGHQVAVNLQMDVRKIGATSVFCNFDYEIGPYLRA